MRTAWFWKSLKSTEGHTVNVSLPMISVQYHSYPLLTFCCIGRSLWILTTLPVTLLRRGYLKLIPFNKSLHFLQPTAKTTENKPPPHLRNKLYIFQPLIFQSLTRLLSGWVVSTIAIFFLASLFQFVSPLPHKNPRNG